MSELSEQERLQRWRLILGQSAQDDLGRLDGPYAQMDGVLESLYNADAQNRRAGLGSSSPKVHRWLGDIRRFFPVSTVRVLQKDAMTRLGLQQMLLEPELLAEVEADVALVGTLLSLSRVLPAKTRETARQVVRKVVQEVEKRLKQRMIASVTGALNRSLRTNRPRAHEIDWHSTIRKNLKNYQPDRGTIIVDRLVGFGRNRSALRDIVLCVDQSGSMAASVVYAGIFGAVLASLKAVQTKMIVFDTEVIDLTAVMQDPVDLLFGTQLGGGTDIHKALTYCQAQITRPTKTILVLISDLYEGGNSRGMLQKAAEMVAAGVQMIALLALSDEGKPAYDADVAAAFASLGIPSFACTPDLFPELIAQAIQKKDIAEWAAKNDLTPARSSAS